MFNIAAPYLLGNMPRIYFSRDYLICLQDKQAHIRTKDEVAGSSFSFDSGQEFQGAFLQKRYDDRPKHKTIDKQFYKVEHCLLCRCKFHKISSGIVETIAIMFPLYFLLKIK